VKFGEKNPDISIDRICYVYRLSEVHDDPSGCTQDQRMRLARYLSTCDNTTTQATAKYNAQTPLVLMHLWKELYDMNGRPTMRMAGKHTPEFVEFRQQCVAGAEHLANLLEKSSTTLTPLLKVATLPDDDGDPSTFEKMSGILCSMDDRVDPSGLTLIRLPYINLVPPLTEEEEAQGKKWTGRIMKFEDLKEVSRVPYDDRVNFINLVYDEKYAINTRDIGTPPKRPTQMRRTTTLAVRCVPFTLVKTSLK